MITDVEAARIASEWHGGGGSALYVLASSGAIVLGDEGMEWISAKHEIEACFDGPYQDIRDSHDLNGLLSYVEHHGSRGPIEGWGKLSW